MQQTSDTTALQIPAAPPCPWWCIDHDDTDPRWDVSTSGDIERRCSSAARGVVPADTGMAEPMGLERFASFDPSDETPLDVQPTVLRAFGHAFTIDESIELATEIVNLIGADLAGGSSEAIGRVIEAIRQESYDRGYSDARSVHRSGPREAHA
jgi:hypothetical protein